MQKWGTGWKINRPGDISQEAIAPVHSAILSDNGDT